MQGQHERRKAKATAADREILAIKQKAEKWDAHLKAEADDKVRTRLTLVFLAIFLILLVAGLVTGVPPRVFIIITILGVGGAGGLGGAVRMIVGGIPLSNTSRPIILGIVVGVVFRVLYMLPQLVGGTGLFLPGSDGITGIIRVQYLSAMVVAFMAGLAFDSAIEQLLRRAKDRGDELITAGTTDKAP